MSDWYESDTDYTGWVLIDDRWPREEWWLEAWNWVRMRFPTRYRRARLAAQMVRSLSVAAWHATHKMDLSAGVGRVYGVRVVESR